jgi:hypothetical protein
MAQYAKDEESSEAQARAMKERIEARKKELAEKKAQKVRWPAFVYFPRFTCVMMNSFSFLCFVHSFTLVSCDFNF